MNELKNRHDEELNRMYDKLASLEPGTDEYEEMMGQIMKARAGEADIMKIEAEKDTAKKELYVKVALGIGTIVAVPIVETICKRNLASFIGKVEQMEYFTSSAGRSISGWFRWK